MNKKIIYGLFLAFALRMLAIFILGRHISPEVWEYDILALNIISQKCYVIDHLNTQYYSFGYPMYSILSAFFHVLTNQNYLILEIFQIILAVVTCYLVYLIGERIFNKEIGLASSFLVAMHPGLIIYSTKIHELTLVTFFMTFTIWVLISSNWKDKIHSNIFIGCLIGLGILTRPTLIFLLPISLAYFWLSSKMFNKSFMAFLIVCVTTILVILPWTIRNYNIHKRWLFITTTSAEHFWRGNNPMASGSGLTADNKGILNIAPREFLEKLYKMNEIEQYDFFYNETIKFIKSNPLSFVKMIFKKFFYFWWFSPQTGLWYQKYWTIIYKIYYGMLFLTFIFGLYFSLIKLNGINKVAVISLIILFILISLSNSLYYVETRHRWAIEPLMLIISVYGIENILKARKYIEKCLKTRISSAYPR